MYDVKRIVTHIDYYAAPPSYESYSSCRNVILEITEHSK